MSGSFKKAAKSFQKVHRERSQPEHRAHLGNLEKHKDYVERAREHHKKRDKIKALRQKAANRNPDEFYFNMVATEKLDGVHQSKEDKIETSEDQQLLLQRQDLRYVCLKRDMEQKKIEKLQSQLALLDPQFRQNKHTVFVDSAQDVSKAMSRVQKAHDTVQQKLLSLTTEQQQELDKNYGLLAKRMGRLKDLTCVMEKLEVSLHLSKDKSSQKKLVKEETKDSAAVYRWCYKRKR